MQYAPKNPFIKWEVVALVLAAIVVALLLTGCGSKREEIQRIEREDQATTRTTTVAETTKPTPQGPALVESTKTTTFTEQVAKGVTDAQIKSETTLQAPEVKAFVTAATGVIAPGFGGVISMALGWLTGTPDGAAVGLGTAGLMTALAKRGISGELNLRNKDRHLNAVVKGNSDFMQAHPEHADKLKASQRSAQVDPTLKAAVKQIRVDNGMA